MWSKANATRSSARTAISFVYLQYVQTLSYEYFPLLAEGEGTLLLKRASVSYSNACCTMGCSHGCCPTSRVQAPYVAMVMGRRRASASRRANTACKIRPVKGVYRKKNVPSV